MIARGHPPTPPDPHMCGICGIYSFGRDRPVDRKVLAAMTASLAHRGPDDEGEYVERFLALGHRRLSIIDIDGGSQPMTNEDGSVWIVYNGEIYNHASLRQELKAKGHVFKSSCDTEVIIHAYEQHGPDCVDLFNGMFAFAIWDSRHQTLFLARDRLGIKPLYYTTAGGHFLFASEIKALLTHPLVHTEVEPASIPEYLFCTSLLDDHTMFKNIHSLRAGHRLLFENGAPREEEYWDVPVNNTALADFDPCTGQDRILELLDDSVRLRLMSDVPFGSLLSGGLDSSAVSALATGHMRQRLQTFSMEYSQNIEIEPTDVDTHYARLVADAFNTAHTEFIFQPDEYSDLQERVSWHVEKPVEVTTPSLYLLHRSLKPHVTVVLSGEGADELFAGYYFFLNGLPSDRLDEFPWAPYFSEVSSLLDDDVARETRFHERVHDKLDELMQKFASADFLNRVLYLFLKVYLLEMLERQDKTSMAWGVETRVPFLDHRLVEYVANIPSAFKMRGESEKHILKESVRRILPAAIVDRVKKPFPFPRDPRSILQQRNRANDLVQSSTSSISQYFKKKETDAFFRKRNGYSSTDNLALFRTSYALIALEQWHKAFGI